MKYQLLILTVFLHLNCNGPAGSSANTTFIEQAEPPNIVLDISGLQAGQAVLVGTYGDQQYSADTTRVSGSRIVFNRDQPYEQGFFFVWLPNEKPVQFLLTADQAFTLKADVKDIVGTMEVEGSLENELLYHNLKFEADYQPRYSALTRELNALGPESPNYEQLKARQEALSASREAHLDSIFSKYPNAFFTSYKRAGQNPIIKDVRLPDGTLDEDKQVYLYRKEFWEGVDFQDARLMNTPVIGNKITRYMKEITPQNADSLIKYADFLLTQVEEDSEFYKFITNWIPINYEPGKVPIMDAEALFVHMVQNYFTYDKAFWADSLEVQAIQQRASEMAASRMGQKGPDVVSKNPQGEVRSIYEIEAPYVVIFMYNPTCDHCIEQTPKLVQFYQEWKQKGVEVFAIAIDTEPEVWKKFVRDYQMDFINVFDPTNRSIYGKYYVDVTPEIYVLNPDRIIIGKNLNVDQISTIIERDKAKVN